MQSKVAACVANQQSTHGFSAASSALVGWQLKPAIDKRRAAM
jgi:hypothetical protein